MSERFEYGETDLFEWVEVDGEMISTKECVSKLNKQQTEIDDLKEENRQLRQFINKNRRLSVKELMNNANENEVVIGDKQDKKRMIVIVLSNFMDIPYNRKSFDEIVEWLNELSEENEQLRRDNKFLRDERRLQEKRIKRIETC